MPSPITVSTYNSTQDVTWGPVGMPVNHSVLSPYVSPQHGLAQRTPPVKKHVWAKRSLKHAARQIGIQLLVDS